MMTLAMAESGRQRKNIRSIQSISNTAGINRGETYVGRETQHDNTSTASTTIVSRKSLSLQSYQDSVPTINPALPLNASSDPRIGIGHKMASHTIKNPKGMMRKLQRKIAKRPSLKNLFKKVPKPACTAINKAVVLKSVSSKNIVNVEGVRKTSNGNSNNFNMVRKRVEELPATKASKKRKASVIDFQQDSELGNVTTESAGETNVYMLTKPVQGFRATEAPSKLNIVEEFPVLKSSTKRNGSATGYQKESGFGSVPTEGLDETSEKNGNVNSGIHVISKVEDIPAAKASKKIKALTIDFQSESGFASSLTPLADNRLVPGARLLVVSNGKEFQATFYSSHVSAKDDSLRYKIHYDGNRKQSRSFIPASSVIGFLAKDNSVISLTSTIEDIPAKNSAKTEEAVKSGSVNPRHDNLATIAVKDSPETKTLDQLKKSKNAAAAASDDELVDNRLVPGVRLLVVSNGKEFQATFYSSHVSAKDGSLRYKIHYDGNRKQSRSFIPASSVKGFLAEDTPVVKDPPETNVPDQRTKSKEADFKLIDHLLVPGARLLVFTNNTEFRCTFYSSHVSAKDGSLRCKIHYDGTRKHSRCYIPASSIKGFLKEDNSVMSLESVIKDVQRKNIAKT